jgi:adenosine kinase
VSPFHCDIIFCCFPVDYQSNTHLHDYFSNLTFRLSPVSYDEIALRADAEFIAGGAGQNSIRAATWMLQKPGVGHYTGAVGKDETAAKLKEVAERDGVTTHYYVADAAPTGRCAVLVKDKERSLIALLGAANHFHLSHLDSQHMQGVLNKAKIFYATGFFLTVEPEALIRIGKHANEHNKTFVMNISAPFLVQFFWDKMQSVLPYTDYIICNEHEAAAFAKQSGWDEADLKGAAAKIAALPKNTEKERVVIFTQGANPTLVFQGGKIHEFAVPAVPANEIVDTNGAGDAFVGGFLAGLVKGVSLAESVEAGHNCAGHVIRLPGATFPPKPDFKFSK